MNTLIDDFNQPKMTYSNPNTAPIIMNQLPNPINQADVVKSKKSRIKCALKVVKSKASIKRLVKKINPKKLIFAVTVIVFVLIPVIGIINSWSNADTGTQTIYPNADYGTLNNFAQTGGTPTAGNHCANGTHCNYVDYNDSANTTYVGTGSTMDTTSAEEEFDFTDLSIDGTLTQVTSVTVTVKAQIITLAGGGTNADGLNVRLYINGAYNGTTNSVTMSTTETSHTFTWNGLTATTASDIRAEIVRVANGTGSGSAKDDDIRIYEVKTSVNYNYSPIKPMLTLEGYTFENDDNTSSPDVLSTMAGSSFSSGKTLTSVRQGERLTLRAHVSNSGGPLPSTTELGLFYDRGDGKWTQVKNQQKLNIGPSSGNDCEGFDNSGGSQLFTCTAIVDGDNGSDVFRHSSLVFDASGDPWISFANYEGATSDLVVAEYVGSGGNCDGFDDVGGSDAWQCTTIFDGDSSADADYHSSLAFDASGNPWISFVNFESSTTDLTVAKYVGSGGNCDGYDNTGGSDAWQCTTVVDGDSGGDAYRHSSLAFDASGNPWISFTDSEGTQSNLTVAKYVGSGGNCDGYDNTGGSDAWQCIMIFNGDTAGDVSRHSSLAFDASGNPWISFANSEDSTSDLVVAKYVGSGGNCDGFDNVGGSDAWQCTTVVDGDSSDDAYYHSSLAFDASGNPWISFANSEDSTSDLVVAKYVGSGGNCDGFDNVGGSDAWQCTTVVDGDSTSDATNHSSLAFDASGNPWISFTDRENSTGDLTVAKYVGSGGNCDGYDNTGGSDAWQCTTVVDGDSTSDATNHSSLAFDASGNPWISFGNNESLGGDLTVVKFERDGEIQFSPSLAGLGSRTILKSHADMTGSGDSTNRDNANCLISATWNNGILSSGSTVGGFSMPAGSSTKQCTEVAWTIDTSQAIPGTTYRFMIATKDSFRPDKGVWRGPASIASDAYPTLTIMPASEQSYKYSKDILGPFTSNNCGTSGSSSWSCSTIDNDTTDNTGQYSQLAFSPNGKPYASYYDATNHRLYVAEYVGYDGSGCGTSGSTAWKCTLVDSSGNYAGNSLSFAPDGTLYVSYTTQGQELRVARYVGSGGSGCLSAEWSCDSITSGIYGTYDANITSIRFINGSPTVVFSNLTNQSLDVARYIGSGGTGCALTSRWSCSTVYDDNTYYVYETRLEVGSHGEQYISFAISGDNYILGFAKFVGSGGTGCGGSGSVAWNCTMVASNSTNGYGNGYKHDLAVSPSGVPYVSYYCTGGGTHLCVAKFVGSGGTGCGDLGSSQWRCTRIDEGTNENSISFSPTGTPLISFADSTTGLQGLNLAEYVGSGGTGCSVSNEWKCSYIDEDTADTTGRYPSMSFSNDGAFYVTYFDTSRSALMIARTNLTKFYPSEVTYSYNGRYAGSVNGRFWLNSGTAPYGNWQGSCGGNTDQFGYCGLYKNDGQYDSLNAQIGERPLYNMQTKFSSDNTVPTAKIYFKSSVSPSDSNVIVQAYRFGSTNAWETVKTVTSSGCTTSNCYIEAMPSGTASEYYDQKGSDYWVYFRVYQNESYSSGITFKLDMFRADQPQSLMRGGRVFRENLKDPFTFTR